MAKDEDQDWGAQAEGPTVLSPSFDDMLAERGEPALADAQTAQGPSYDERLAAMDERVTEPEPPPAPPASDPFAPPSASSRDQAAAVAAADTSTPYPGQRELPDYLTQRHDTRAQRADQAKVAARPSAVAMFALSAGVVFVGGGLLLAIAFWLLL